MGVGSYKTEKIRNVVLLGHGGCGKTTLIESIAYISNVTKRIRTVLDGGTISDYDKEEIKRKCSLQTTLVPVDWEGTKINILDTPGSFDFAGEVFQALSVADGAVIVVSGKNGVEVGTKKAYEYCEKAGIPCMFFVTDMDDEHADYMGTVNQLKALYGKKIAPFHLPLYENEKFTGFVNVVKMGGRKFNGDGTYVDYDIPEDIDDNLPACREMILEAVAETSDALMNKYFDGIPFTQEEISLALRNHVNDRTVMPVLMGCGTDGKGARMLLQAIEKYFKAPDCKEEDDISLYVYKTIVDPFIGKYSLFQVRSGILKPDMVLYNASADLEERAGKIYVFTGSKVSEVSELHAGDLGAIAKLSGTKTGHTLSLKSKPVIYEKAYMPTPYAFMGYETKSKGDEDKVASALHKLMDEDLTLREVNDKENGQLLLYGLGEQQLEVVVSKLLSRYKVEIQLTKPKIAYKETIRKKAVAQGKYKKQSGGHGQYGDVKMEFEPSGNLEAAYEFHEKVFGGAVPKNFFPAVEKGIAESCLKGPIGEYPVVGIKATLVDGSYHPVDSSEMAFKMAAITAFKNAMKDAAPVLLEPIVNLKVVVPEEFTGDVMGDLNKRTGKIMGMNPLEENHKKQEITAEVPLAQLVGYSTVLRSMTGGAGDYAYTFSHYTQKLS